MGRPFMLLNHYFSYKIVATKLIAHFRNHRLKVKITTTTGKRQTKDLLIEGSNITRNKPLAYVYYNNLMDPKTQTSNSPLKTIKENKMFTLSDQKIKLDRALTKANLIKSSKKLHIPQNSGSIYHEKDIIGTSLKEMESIDHNLDPIFTNDDILHAQNPEDWDQTSRKPSMSDL